MNRDILRVNRAGVALAVDLDELRELRVDPEEPCAVLILVCKAILAEHDRLAARVAELESRRHPE